MEKYFYVRVGTAANTEDDEATGSTVYPVSAFRGMCSGTSDQKGAVTDDDDALSLFFTPKASTGSGGDADDVQGDNVDVVVLACAQYGQKAVMRNLVAAMQGHPHGGKHGGFVTLYDGYTNKPSVDPTTDIAGVTGATVLHVENAD
tara:strand:+ start:262 stop:699 length:438 start_codon:yes stop_codon:yes gene_type:complete